MTLQLFRPNLFALSPDAGGSTAGGDPDPEEPEGGEVKTTPKGLTQEQVDAIVNKRLVQKEKSVMDNVLKELGVKDLAEAKTLTETQRKAQADQQTQAEKAAIDLKTAQDQLATAQKETAEKLEAMQKRVLDSELKIEASKLVMVKVKKDGKEVEVVSRLPFKPEALDDVALLVDRSKIKEVEGKYEGVAEALDALAKAKPWLMTDAVQSVQLGKGSPRPVTGSEKPSGATKGVKPTRVRL